MKHPTGKEKNVGHIGQRRCTFTALILLISCCHIFVSFVKHFADPRLPIRAKSAFVAAEYLCRKASLTRSCRDSLQTPGVDLLGFLLFWFLMDAKGRPCCSGTLFPKHQKSSHTFGIAQTELGQIPEVGFSPICFAAIRKILFLVPSQGHKSG